MKNFARLQNDFQDCVMTDDVSVLSDLVQGSRASREVLFGVYKFAYVSRLVEAMRKDYEYLHGYLGDETFDEMARSYISAKPSRQANLRWFSHAVPNFLKENEPYSRHPILSELAALETALSDAIDAADDAVLDLADMAALPPEAWKDLRLRRHPTSCRLDCSTNVAAVWMSLKNDETPPDVADISSQLLIWRQDAMPMFRELSEEEGMMWDEAAKGVSFGVLCSMLAMYDDPDSAAARAAGYLHGWVTAGLLAGDHRDDA
jgi:hypothetical protein